MTLGEQVLAAVDARRDELIERCRRLLQIQSIDRESYPPGDTTEVCRFARADLDAPGVERWDVTVREGLPNLIATVPGAGPGPHVVLNGHFDTYPAGDRSLWTHDPFGGEVVGDRIYGRGAIDMKGGDAALMTVFLIMAEHRREWQGRVTLTLVSDEETGAKYGAEHLVAHCPEVQGDLVLSAEPSGAGLVRFGEKGASRLTFTANGVSGHSPVPSMGRNANHLLMDFLVDLRTLAGPYAGIPVWLREMAEKIGPTFDAMYGEGAARYILETTVNVGVLRGGQKDSLIPFHAEAWVDIRMPFGFTHDALIKEVRARLARHLHIDCEVRHWRDPNFTDPQHPLVRTMVESVEAVRGAAVELSCSLGGTDCRFWRRRGTPCVVYGPTPHNIAAPDEYIEIKDLVSVAKAHALALTKLLV
ncbi:MAG: M20 family metallopeptidase [bacterium]